MSTKKNFSEKELMEEAESLQQEAVQPEAEQNEQKQENENNMENNQPTAEEIKEMVFKRFIYMEAAYRTQEVNPREHVEIPRASADKMVSLADVLDLLSAGMAAKYNGRAFVTRRLGEEVTTTSEEDAAATLAHSPFKYVFEHNDDDSSSVLDAAVNLSLEFVGQDGTSAYTQIALKPLGSTENSVYVRLTVMSPSVGADDLRTSRSGSEPDVYSCVVVYDVKDPSADLQRFDEIEQATQEKLKEQQPLEPLEDEMMRGMQGISYPAYNLGYGKWLLDHHRYYDAYVVYQRVYNCLKPDLAHLQKEAQEAFYHACYGMGICLRQLGFLDKAAYYLQLSMIGNDEFIASYVETLALHSHNRVCYYLNQLRSQVAQAPSAAEEIKRIEKLAAESEERHQQQVVERIDWGMLPLGYVLHHFYDAVPECLMGASVITPAEAEPVKVLAAKEEIWQLNLYELKDATVYIGYSRAAWEMKVPYDASHLCQNGCIVMNVRTVKSAEGKPYVRVDLVAPNFAHNDEKRFPAPFNLPEYHSFVLGLEGEQHQSARTELEEIYQKSLELKHSFRTVEAMRGFEYLHNVLKVEYTKVTASDEMEEMFFDATYELGFCLVELEQYERAAYYLDWVQEGGKAEYAREFVNCLCNSGDVRALEVIDGVMKGMKKPENPEFAESYAYFMAFMNRRKAFVLVSRGMIDEAKQLLQELLNDPISKDFAQQELDYLSKMGK